MSRKLRTLILVGISAAFMAACGGGNTTNGISIGFSQAPPAALQTSTPVSVAAVVVNDSSSAGVDWTVTCGSADCGTLAPTHTDSGAATTYTAPASVPTGNTVTITATATASSSAVTTGTVTITTNSTGTGLNGQYAFLITGFDAFNANYYAVGSIIADGNGNITGGEEDFCDDANGCSSAVLSGSYSTGGDSRGSINLTNTNANIGPQTLAMVVTSSSHALIIEFDGFATSSGTLDLQDTSALTGSAISGGYSFAVNGIDIQQGFAAALGGVMTGDGSGGFTNVTLDENDGGDFSSGTTAFGASAPPDSFGRVVVGDPNVAFVYYIVNAKALRFVEVDQNLFLTSGSAYTQGTSSLNVANLAGNSVFTEAGISSLGFLGLAGQFTADSGGNVSTSFMDVNDDGNLSNGSISGSAFTNFVNARGNLTLEGDVNSNVSNFQVYLVDPGVNILDPNSSSGGGGALLLDSDQNAAGIGEIIPQASGAQFSGNYGLNIQAFSSTAENDLEGQLTATSTNLTGNADVNSLFTLFPAQPITGSVSADSSNPGRFTASLTAGTFGTFNLVYYQASNSQLVIVEADQGQVGTGTVVQQQ